MTSFDYAVIVIIAVSVGLGMWRGLVYEALSLAGWIAAYFVARLFATEVMQSLPGVIDSAAARMAVAYVLLFLATLLVAAVLALLMSRLVKGVGMGVSDASLGGVFGLLRGVFIVLALVWLAGLTELPKKTFWRDAWLSQPLQQAALLTKDCLPEEVAKKLVY